MNCSRRLTGVIKKKHLKSNTKSSVIFQEDGMKEKKISIISRSKNQINISNEPYRIFEFTKLKTKKIRKK